MFLQPPLGGFAPRCVRIDVQYHPDGTVSIETQLSDDRRWLARAQAEAYDGLTAAEALDVATGVLGLILEVQRASADGGAV